MTWAAGLLPPSTLVQCRRGLRQTRTETRALGLINRKAFPAQHVSVPFPFAAKDKAVYFPTNFKQEAEQREGIFWFFGLERHVSIVGLGL